MLSRDWTKTLWAASYKGFPFFFETDDEEGGLGIVVHEFPNSDVPFNEDLGEKARYFSGNAYVTGDAADAQSAAFIAALVSHGPGVLVIPTRGPILVRALPFKRRSEKDRAGYICFEVKFVREGATSALASLPYLSQLAFNATAALASALAGSADAIVVVDNVATFVAAAAADEFVSVVGAVEAVRTSYPVDTTTSANVTSNDQAVVNYADLLLDPAGAATSDIYNFSIITDLITPAQPAPATGVAALTMALTATLASLGAGLNPPTAQDAMARLIDAFAPPAASAALSPNAALAAQNVAGVLQVARLAALTAWANALVARTYTDRPAAVTARAEAAERFERELNQCPGAAYAQLYLAIEQVQAAVVFYLTQLMANLAPVISVRTSIFRPSLVAAWTLYQDPTRSVDLVLRNQVRHPSFMPREFAALVPGYNAPGIPTAWPATPL